MNMCIINLFFFNENETLSIIQGMRSCVPPLTHKRVLVKYHSCIKKVALL